MNGTSLKMWMAKSATWWLPIIQEQWLLLMNSWWINNPVARFKIQSRHRTKGRWIAGGDTYNFNVCVDIQFHAHAKCHWQSFKAIYSIHSPFMVNVSIRLNKSTVNRCAISQIILMWIECAMCTTLKHHTIHPYIHKFLRCVSFAQPRLHVSEGNLYLEAPVLSF